MTNEELSEKIFKTLELYFAGDLYVLTNYKGTLRHKKDAYKLMIKSILDSRPVPESAEKVASKILNSYHQGFDPNTGKSEYEFEYDGKKYTKWSDIIKAIARLIEGYAEEREKKAVDEYIESSNEREGKIRKGW